MARANKLPPMRTRLIHVLGLLGHKVARSAKLADVRLIAIQLLNPDEPKTDDQLLDELNRLLPIDSGKCLLLSFNLIDELLRVCQEDLGAQTEEFIREVPIYLGKLPCSVAEQTKAIMQDIVGLHLHLRPNSLLVDAVAKELAK